MNNTCTSCPQGYYNDLSGMAACTPCAAGTITTTPGSINCSSCPSGTFSLNNTCAQCPAGTYSNLTGAPACTTCTTGLVSPAGSTSCVETCPPATNQQGTQCLPPTTPDQISDDGGVADNGDTGFSLSGGAAVAIIVVLVVCLGGIGFLAFKLYKNGQGRRDSAGLNTSQAFDRRLELGEVVIADRGTNELL